MTPQPPYDGIKRLQRFTASKSSVAWAVGGCVVFGILMGWRGDVDSIALRAIVAGTGAGMLAFCLIKSTEAAKK